MLLLDATSEQTVGLIEQTPWCREASSYGKKHQRKKRAYEDKESYKWEQASIQAKARLGDMMKRTISICDREADLYEYLNYKLQHDQRFVVRAKVDRHVLESQAGLFETLEKKGVELCCYTGASSTAWRQAGAQGQAVIAQRGFDSQGACGQRGKVWPSMHQCRVGRRDRCPIGSGAATLDAVDYRSRCQCAGSFDGGAVLRMPLADRGLSQGVEKRCGRRAAAFPKSGESGAHGSHYGVSCGTAVTAT